MTKEETPVGPDTPAGRLRQLRKDANFPSMNSFAKKHGLPAATYAFHENAKRGITKAKAALYAKLLNSTQAWILLGMGSAHPGGETPSKNERIPLDSPRNVDDHEASSRDQLLQKRQADTNLLPVFSSERGPGGGFVMSATPAKFVSLPARLSDVENARALYMVGDDMFPRLKHGELIFPHPHELPMPESVVIIVYKRTPQEWAARDLVLDDGGERIVVRRYGKNNAAGTEEIICRSEILRIEATVSPTYFG